MSRALRVAVVGYGIAGAALALQLGRRGHAVECFERRAESAAGGAGLLLAPAALTLLRALGLADALRRCGSVVSGLRATQASERVLLDWDARRWGHASLGLGIERRILHDLLASAAARVAKVHRGIEVASVDSERGFVLDAAGASLGHFDLVLACDGANSVLRAGRPTLVQRVHRYDWCALSCLMRSERHPPAPETLEQRFSGPHHVSCWPVGRTEGDAATKLCVSVNVPAAAASQFAGATAWRTEFRRFGASFAQRFDCLQPLTPWVALSCRDVVLRRYVRQRLVFVGDAAHCLSPQLGQGTRLALAGAAHLADALDRHERLGDALAEYEQRQRALALRYQRASRWITPLFQSQRSALVWLREQGVSRLARLRAIERGVMAWLCDPIAAR